MLPVEILKTFFLLSAYSSAVWNAASWKVKSDTTESHAGHFHVNVVDVNKYLMIYSVINLQPLDNYKANFLLPNLEFVLTERS